MPQSGAGYAGAQVSAIIIIIMSNSYRVALPQAYCSGDDQSCRDYIIFTKVYQASEDIRKKNKQRGNGRESGAFFDSGAPRLRLRLERLGHEFEIRNDLVESLSAVHNVVARDVLECRQLFGFWSRGCDPGVGFCDILAGASDVSLLNKFKKVTSVHCCNYFILPCIQTSK